MSKTVTKKRSRLPSMQTLISFDVLIVTAFFTWIIYNNLPIIGDAWPPRVFGQERGGRLAFAIQGHIDGYSNGNPRIGQFWLIFYGYFPKIHAAIFAFAIPALIWLLGAHVIGRNLIARFSHIVFAGVITLAIFWLIDREIGATMYYQATSGNYLFALLLLLTFLLPFRMALGIANDETATEGTEVRLGIVKFGLWLIIAFLAGMGHETYGPTVIVGLAIAFYFAPIFKVQRKRWMVAGWLSFALGYAALVIAPGQDKRYTDGRLESVLVEPSVLLDRALNLLSLFIGSGAWLLAAAILIGGARFYWKRTPWNVAIVFVGFIGLGLGMSLTGIGAPDTIIGERFVFASHACLAIAICGLIFGKMKNAFVLWVTFLTAGGYLVLEYVQTSQAYAAYNQQFNAQANAIRVALKQEKNEADVPSYSLPFYKLKKYIWKEFPQIGPNPKVNIMIARYYGIGRITAVPSEDTKAFGQRLVDNPLRLKYMDCPKNDGERWDGPDDPLGTLVCELDYLVYFNSEDSTWVVSGFSESPGGKINLRYAVKRQIAKHPDSGILPIWGGVNYYSPTGDVTSAKGVLLGRLTEPTVMQDIEKGSMIFSLDKCGQDDGAVWEDKKDPFGVLICGEEYAMTWNKKIVEIEPSNTEAVDEATPDTESLGAETSDSSTKDAQAGDEQPGDAQAGDEKPADAEPLYSETTVWKFTGLQERTRGVPIITHREVTGLTPDEGQINLLGLPYAFNGDGVVRDKVGKRIGELRKPVFIDAVKNGPMILSLDKCNDDDGADWKGERDPFGVLLCGEDYVMTWDKETTVWKFSGLQERTRGVPIITYREVTGQTPDDGEINLLGRPYSFDGEGVVRNSSGKGIGKLERPRYINALKTGPVVFSLDKCGENDGAVWKAERDLFGALICGEDYTVTWNKETKVWRFSGLQERAEGAPIITDREVTGETPDDGQINLLGLPFDFNRKGIVRNNSGKRIGKLRVPAGT